ncbi:hypothetical protein Ae717Ps2_7090 [Pseudonocardia sp. Ae717_Ps2]|uniref:hypothetical protein n=1 Tax=Pseudonocardia sp. Ae717_Ps2 TaxID=1885573 RepID=UPI00095BC612|nr:hypothetical protein [Pseudonocardia sp. Ae717_Ps2]OLM27872.1 hypothetical protein Ae717Ps2_7090 [Pseudonocardia sp. Ae717_Ps2]
MTTPATTTTATTTGEQLVVGKSTRTTARPQGGRGPEATRQHRVASPRTSSRLAVQVADGRELAVLLDGPWRGRWYWRADLDALQTAAGRYPHGHPAAELRAYAPTGTWTEHPTEPEVTGRVWRHHPHTTRTATITRRTA